MRAEEVQREGENWPLWSAVANALRKRDDYGYGMTIDTAWFEDGFSCRRETNEFAFAMMDLRQSMESEDGYYMRSQTVTEDETGLRKEVWQIPAAIEHENVAQGFETKMRRFARRSVDIRDKTLKNAKADLTAEQRSKMEKSTEIAAVRTVLLRREGRCVEFLKANGPKLLI